MDTTSGFGITVASGNAFTLTGFGGIDFTDANASSIFGDLRGMDARNTGGGSLNITSTGTITGLTDHGIYAGNNAFGTGVSINVEDVGGGLDGIRAYNNGGGVLGAFEPKAFCPGFLRGLSFYGKYAFVGLSKPRYKRFEGLALDQRLKDSDADPWCGVQVIDIETGACVDWVRIDGAIGELYDVSVIPGAVCAMALSPGTNEAISLITHRKA